MQENSKIKKLATFFDLEGDDFFNFYDGMHGESKMFLLMELEFFKEAKATKLKTKNKRRNATERTIEKKGFGSPLGNRWMVITSDQSSLLEECNYARKMGFSRG